MSFRALFPQLARGALAATFAATFAASGAEAQILPYDQAVPEDLRSIVTQADYDANLASALPSLEARF